MWVVQYCHHGGPEQLQVAQVPPPTLRRGQALVRIVSSCVSRVDALYLAGRLPHGIGFPKQVGLDAIGQVVDANGTSLTDGRWVAIVLGLEPWARRGTTVELLAIEPSRCGLFPADYVPVKDDCALVLGGLTALRAIRDGLKIHPGDHVLVVGAGGPVGLAAIQIARLYGASVDAVAGARALSTCQEMGAQEVWNHHSDTSRLRSSRGYDGIVLAAGRPSDWFDTLRSRGRMALTDGSVWPASIPGAIRHKVKAVPIAAGHASSNLTWLAERVANRELVPVVDSRHAPSEIRSPFESLTQAGTLGARLIEHPDIS